MSRRLNCHRCHSFLGEIEKGALRKGAVLLCKECWERADLAIQMADLAARQGKEALKGGGSEVVDNLMDMFGMKK